MRKGKTLAKMFGHGVAFKREATRKTEELLAIAKAPIVTKSLIRKVEAIVAATGPAVLPNGNWGHFHEGDAIDFDLWAQICLMAGENLALRFDLNEDTVVVGLKTFQNKAGKVVGFGALQGRDKSRLALPSHESTGLILPGR